MACVAAQSTAPRIVGLEADAAVEPLGIDDRAPRFSWRIEADRPAVHQTTYRVVVATSATSAARAHGPGLVWDSSVVRSDDPFVVYAGPALASRTRYYWTVRIGITGARGALSSPVSWFETAYLSADEWKGDWIAGPQRIERPLTAAEGAADDSCCLAVDTRLNSPAASGDSTIKVASVAGFMAGRRFAIGGETVTASHVGTPAASTVLTFAAHAGADNIRVASVTGFAPGVPIIIGSFRGRIGAVGSATTTARLASATAAGAITAEIRGAAAVGIGEPIVIGGEDRVITDVLPDHNVAVAQPAGMSEANEGAAGRARTVTVRFTPALSSAHAAGTTVSLAGTGITFAPPLPSPEPAGTAVTTPGTGVSFTPPLKTAWDAGTKIAGEAPGDFCRPPGARGNSGACREIRPAPMLRKAFAVSPVSEHGPVISARVYSAGLAYNNMTLNGTRASSRVLDPGFTNYADTVLYTTDDVTSLIRQQPSAEAANVIATQLGSGQFDDETTSGDWNWERAEWRATPRLRLDLYVKYADGTEQVIKSDGSWKVTTDGPTRYDGYYLGETYDARREIPSWDGPNYDDSAWPPARVVTAPRGVLRAETEEPTREVAHSSPGPRANPKPGIYVWNTGLQRAGWAVVSIYGARRGMPIQVFYSDKTAADGTVSSSGYTADGQIQTDFYIAKGTGTAEHPEVFTPQFTYKGFQYIQISSPSNPASQSGGTPQPLPDGVVATVDSIREIRTPIEDTGSFEAANPLLYTIERNTRAAVAENYVGGIITDTPEYEKNPWTGDAALSAATASLLFNTQRQYMKSLEDMVDNQVAATGEVSLLAPTNEGYGYVGQTFKPATDAGATPIWDAFWFVLPWESYMRYGDLRTLQVAYPLMKKYLDQWLPQWTGKDGDNYRYTLTSGLGDWDPPTGADAPEGASTRVHVPPVVAPATTAYYAYLAKIAADSARALGKTGDAAHFDLIFADIRRDFNARWWDAGVGYYREGPDQIFLQSMQALPLAFDLVPAEKRADLEAKLVDDIMKTRARHEEVGIAGARWILPALSQADAEGVAGAADAAYAVASQTTYPSYGYWISLGWTSLGESWEKTSRTRSHHMFGPVTQWFYENLAGIRPLEPGYKQIAFAPTVPAGLDHAEASYESVRGRIVSSWRREGSTLTLDVTVPPNAGGIVYVPAAAPDNITVANATFMGKQGARLVYRLESGSYRFTVRR